MNIIIKIRGKSGIKYIYVAAIVIFVGFRFIIAVIADITDGLGKRTHVLLCSYSHNDVPNDSQRNVSVAAVRSAVRPSIRTHVYSL